MQLTRSARARLLLAWLPIFSMGCVSLSPKLNTLPSVAKNRADVQYQAAQAAEERGQWQKARELYTALHRNSPRDPKYSHRIAYACMQLGDFQAAEQFFELARTQDPKNPELLFDMGSAAYSQKQYRRAEALFAEAVRLNPEDARATNSLAMSIGFQKRYDESLKVFRRVNNETQSLLNVAYIYSQTNEPDQAIAHYQRVLASDPHNQYATNALKQLQSIRPAAVSTADRKPSADTSTAQATSPIIQQTSAVQWQPIDSRQDAFAPSHRADVVQVAANSTMAPDVGGPVIIPAVDVTPRTNFQAPVITPLNSSPEPTSLIVQNPPREIKVAQLVSEPQPPQELTSEQALELPNEVPTRAEVVPEVPPAPTDEQPIKPADGQENIPAESAVPLSEELTDLEWAKSELSNQSNAIPQQDVAPVRKDDCFRGFCPVAIRDERRLRSTHEEFAYEFQGHTYRFSSAEALTRFQEHPEWYVPVAGGLDVTEFKRGQAVTLGSLEYAVWFRHRLHMFSSAENLAEFRADPSSCVVSP